MHVLLFIGLFVACGADPCAIVDMLGTGVNIFKDDLSKPADLKGQRIFEEYDPKCVKTVQSNETFFSLDILQSGADFRAYFLNTTAVPFLTIAIEDTMRQFDPVYEINTDAFTLARRIYEVRSLQNLECLSKLTLQDRLQHWMALLSTNMTTIADWRLWQSLVDSFHLSHVVMSVAAGVQMQIFVSCPDKDQTLWTSCGDLSLRGMDPSVLGCPKTWLPTCGAGGGYTSLEVTVSGGDPRAGMELVFAKYSNDTPPDVVLQNFLESGYEIKKGGTVQPLRIETLFPFSAILRIIGGYQDHADVMDEVIGEWGYIQCISYYAGAYHWQRTTQNPDGRWLWRCAPNSSPPGPEDALEMPWVSVVVISAVSSALLVSGVYYLCQRRKQRSTKTEILQKRTGNYYKDLAALTSDE